MINIALLSHSSYLAGAERMLFNLGLMLRNDPIFNPIIYIPQGPSKDLENICSDNNVEYRIVERYSQYIGINEKNKRENFKSILECSRNVKEQMLEDNIEIIINNTATSIIGNIIGVELQIPVIGWIHGILDSGLLPGDYDYQERLFMDRIFIELSDKLLYCSKWTNNYYRKYSALKDRIIYNWTPIPDNVEEYDTKNKTFVCLNTFDQYKGIFVLLEAAKILKEKKYDFNILFYGDGSPETKVKIQEFIDINDLNEHIKLMGRTNDISKVYNKTICLVQPSFIESFGMTIIEAMAHRRPVISTQCGGPEEIIENGINGFLVSKDNIEELAEKMQYLLDNIEEGRKMGEEGEKIYYKRFSPKIASELFIKEIKMTIDNYEGISLSKQLLYDMLMKIFKEYENTIEPPLIRENLNFDIKEDTTPIQSEILRFSEAINNNRKYNMIINKDTISKIGIICASEKFSSKQLEGMITMNIYSKDKKLRKSSIKLEEIKQNTWAYFEFIPLIGCKNQLITIELVCDVVAKKQYIGIFEDKRKRTFIYKLCNKLKRPIKGLDVLYIDYKE